MANEGSGRLAWPTPEEREACAVERDYAAAKAALKAGNISTVFHISLAYPGQIGVNDTMEAAVETVGLIAYEKRHKATASRTSRP